MCNNQNQKKIKILIFILIAILLAGCASPGLSDYRYKLGTKCLLNRTSAHQITANCGQSSIPAKIVQLGFNENYLIAKTHPVTILKYPNNPANSYKIPDAKTTYWWIIEIKKDVRYGPFESEQEFMAKTDELGITNTIELMSLSKGLSR